MKKAIMAMVLATVFALSALPAMALEYTQRFGHMGVYDQVEIFYVGSEGAHIERVADYNRLALKWSEIFQNYAWYWKPEPWNINAVNKNYFAGRNPVATQVVWPDYGENFWSYFDLVLEIEKAQQNFFVDVVFRSNKYDYTYEPVRRAWNGQYLTDVPYSKIEYDRTPSSTVPEPSTFLLLGVGVGGFALLRRKKRA